ncbi:hypothetical protein V2A60_003296 [Cordyceps javanica]|uniref:Ubiquitin-like protein DskB n=1 Tax=Cordyceps javanica TaxID=43265 RepID=A0A545W0T1_9HYPO|nr:ubiquitin-like protein DskB [Cordyceps javanica]TQW07583.1 ubiquitin-like protein DskB [Cordyceps javanica]
MADNAEAGGDAQITFKVKTASESTHVITMADSASVLDLKTKLAGEEFENIPVERQRLIYSGRVMKNDDNLSTYKIKPNNIIHMVKSAASNQSQSTSSASAPAPQALPANMASGTANNPLAGLTGARYAGHQVNLPGMDMFGPDGGMGPPMDEERMARMMSDPNVQQTMNEALNNPDFVNMLIDSNPMLRNMPNARELITSPFMREMMSNPAMLTNAMRMQRGLRGGESAFPAPGATDTTPQNPTDTSSTGAQAQGQGQQPPIVNPFLNPFGSGAIPGMSFADMMQTMNAAGLGPGAGAGTGAGTGSGTQTAGQGGADAGAGTGTTGAGANAQNPFAALFPGAGAGAGSGGVNALGMTPEQLQHMSQIMRSMTGGDSGAAAAAPPDNRPPEERYEEQLRQLNDMGFFDFDRNVAALRRSGGSVQGAIEYLLSG